jgi:hypothetical protein
VIPAALLTAAVAQRMFLVHAPPAVIVALAQPVPVANGWGSLGAMLFVATALALAAAFIAYARIVSEGVQIAGFSTAAGLAAFAAFTLACAWAAPALFSSDVYAYAAYGELARLGQDPYAHAPLPNGSPIFAAAVVQWGNPPPACVYGPLFVALASVVVWMTAAKGVAIVLAALRVLASGSLVVCALLAFAAYPGDRRSRLTAAATIVLNPVAIWCAAEGHNDALALAIVLAGVALTRLNCSFTGAFVAAFAGAIKLPALLGALPAAGSSRGRLGAAVGLTLALLLSVPVLVGAVTHLAPHAQYAPQASFQAVVAAAAAALLPAGFATMVAPAAAVLVATAVAVMAVAKLRHGRIEGWLVLAMAGWVLVPNPYPWYGIWLAAVAAIAPGTREAAVLLGLTLTSLLRYLPDAVYPGTPPPSLWLGIAATLPFALLVWPRRFGIINRSP